MVISFSMEQESIDDHGAVEEGEVEVGVFEE